MTPNRCTVGSSPFVRVSPPLPEEIGGTFVPVKPGALERLKEVTRKSIVYEWTFEKRVSTVEKLLRAGHDVRVVVQPEPKQGSASELSVRLLDRITARVVPIVGTEESRQREGAHWVMVLTPP